MEFLFNYFFNKTLYGKLPKWFGYGICRGIRRVQKINPVFHIRNFLANQWFEYLQGDWKFRN